MTSYPPGSNKQQRAPQNAVSLHAHMREFVQSNEVDPFDISKIIEQEYERK
jgi:hypothetical protein